MIRIYATKADIPQITIVKAETNERSRELAGIKDDSYVILCLDDCDLNTLKNNDEILIR